MLWLDLNMSYCDKYLYSGMEYTLGLDNTIQYTCNIQVSNELFTPAHFIVLCYVYLTYVNNKMFGSFISIWTIFKEKVRINIRHLMLLNRHHEVKHGVWFINRGFFLTHAKKWMPGKVHHTTGERFGSYDISITVRSENETGLLLTDENKKETKLRALRLMIIFHIH